MASYDGGPNYLEPFQDKVVYLRSTKGIKYESYTVAASTVVAETVDGVLQKRLSPGTAMSRITSGPEIGKVGPKQAAGTDEVQTLTEGTAITAGTYDVTVLDEVAALIPFDDIAADVQIALRAAASASTNPTYAAIGALIEVTGGPIATTAFTVTFNGAIGVDLPEMTVDVTALTGTIDVATSVPGVAGATDGRETIGNVVGLLNTFMPWQLNQRDVVAAVTTHAHAIASKCVEMDAAGATIVLAAATQTQMHDAETMDITFVA